MTPLSNPRWTLPARVGFRFLFAYLIFFFFPFPAGLVNPEWLGGLFDNFWSAVVPWLADNLLHVQVSSSAIDGSGDTTYHYVCVLCMLLFALLATVIWSVIDCRRDDYAVLHSWTRIWLRYVLALCMLTYGCVKVLMIQFESPGHGRLIQPIGQFSPMALLWTFMGISASYTCFTGLTEVLGGLLLFFAGPRPWVPWSSSGS
jgi:hypothetical protein